MPPTLFIRLIPIIILLFVQCELYSRPAYIYWDNIHLKQNDRWYVKQNNQYAKIDFNNISILFESRYSKKERDSLLTELHCIVRKNVSRNEYQIKIASSTEFFYFLHQVTYNPNIDRVSIRTLGNDRITDSLVTEIRIRDKIFVKKNSEWYMSLAGQLYEIVRDKISLKFKKSIGEKQQQTFISQNNFQPTSKNRLEILDVHIQLPKHAIFYFVQLYQHPVLEFVEVNTRGNY
jgi:hypothetical protein